MGYDCPFKRKIPDNNNDDLGVPDGLFLRPSLICIFDRLEDIVTLVTSLAQIRVSSEAAYEAATERLNAAVSDLQRSLPFRRERLLEAKQIDEPISNTSREEFHEMVNVAKDYINAGDIFQVVPSQRFSIPFDLPPMALYRSLRRLNPPLIYFSLISMSSQLLGLVQKY